MVVMYYFAFWFTTRFGSIAVGFFSLNTTINDENASKRSKMSEDCLNDLAIIAVERSAIKRRVHRWLELLPSRYSRAVVSFFLSIQSLTVLISCSVGMENQEKMKNQMINWMDNYVVLFMKESLQSIVRDPETYLGSLIAFHTVHSLSCLLLMYGAYKVTLCLVYPFIVLELVRLILVTVYFIIAMILYKENVLDLGLLISLCCAGGFALLFLYYCWFCVISFVQIVKQLELSHLMEQDSNTGTRSYHQMNVPSLGMEYYENVGDIAPIAYYNRLEPNVTQHISRFATNFSNQYSSPFRNEHNNYYNALAKPAF